jgi:hypothetical protein
MPFDGSTIIAATLATFDFGQFPDTFSVSGSDVDMVRIDLMAGVHYLFDVDNGASGRLVSAHL